MKNAAVQPPVFERSSMGLPWISTGAVPRWELEMPRGGFLSSLSAKYIPRFFPRNDCEVASPASAGIGDLPELTGDLISPIPSESTMATGSKGLSYGHGHSEKRDLLPELIRGMTVE